MVVKPFRFIFIAVVLCGTFWFPAERVSHAQAVAPTVDLSAQYAKAEYKIPMRDGVKLHTVVYSPKNTAEPYPFLLERTPYSAGPYGPTSFPRSLGPAAAFAAEAYIFVYQDVRGTFLSEGEFEDVRPFNPNKQKPQEIDEASDTYDTVEWLLKNVANHNGRVGVYGISYPGFYATMAALAGHPAIRAVSPQAPVTDWFIGDDDHRNGALFLFDSFNFNMIFGMPRPAPTQMQWRPWSMPTPDAYDFFLRLGPVTNAQKDYFKGKNKYWNDVTTHTTYDAFWQARTPLPHLKQIKTAVMTVGGWFDAEDLYGPLNVYRAIERNNPGVKNTLVMGPWSHGGWAGRGESLGNIVFGSATGDWYKTALELPFFNYYLKDKGGNWHADERAANDTDVWAFRTGANEWHRFAEWPPRGLQTRQLYLQPNGKLGFDTPGESSADKYDEYLSDPAKPVPYTSEINNRRGSGYMIEDQRFAARRPDVLVYETDKLTEDLTLAGPVIADLFVATTGTDADFIVKVIDVYPDDAPNNAPQGAQVKMGGFQLLVRAEMMRGKFRNSLSKPEPFKPNQPTEIKYALQDVHHTFKAGHKLMVQIQSSWFPLADRNPQKFVDIYNAQASDFQKATHRIFRSSKLSSRLQIGVIR